MILEKAFGLRNKVFKKGDPVRPRIQGKEILQSDISDKADIIYNDHGMFYDTESLIGESLLKRILLYNDSILHTIENLGFAPLIEDQHLFSMDDNAYTRNLMTSFLLHNVLTIYLNKNSITENKKEDENIRDGLTFLQHLFGTDCETSRRDLIEISSATAEYLRNNPKVWPAETSFGFGLIDILDKIDDQSGNSSPLAEMIEGVNNYVSAVSVLEEKYDLRSKEHHAIEPFNIFSLNPKKKILPELYIHEELDDECLKSEGLKSEGLKSEGLKGEGLEHYCDGHNLADPVVQILYTLILSDKGKKEFIDQENKYLKNLYVRDNSTLDKEELKLKQNIETLKNEFDKNEYRHDLRDNKNLTAEQLSQLYMDIREHERMTA